MWNRLGAAIVSSGIAVPPGTGYSPVLPLASMASLEWLPLRLSTKRTHDTPSTMWG
jgi:hypothetical protein